MSIADVLSLFSGIALFLFGMTLMGDSLKKVAGNSLEVILYKLAGSPIKGILLGTGVTAAIQSSSATSVMVVGFVNSGMMKVKQAIGVIMGAIIGTSITGWIISLSSIGGSGGVLELLSTETITAITAIVGIILRLFSKYSKQRTIGEILLGFSVLMLGMHTMSSSVAGLRESETFINLLTKFSNPLLGILVGALFTALIQSASAAVGILQALSNTGAINFAIAFPVLMGIAIGASLPVILSALGATSNGKRSAWSYLVIDALGCVVVGIIYYGINAFVAFDINTIQMNTFSIALVNTIFRVVMIGLLAPFIGLIEKITKLIVKTDDEEEVFDGDKLEERFIAHPALALEQTRLVINKMAELTRDNLNQANRLVFSYDEKEFNKVNSNEDLIDRYADKLGTYLVQVTRKELDKKQNIAASEYLQALVDFERVGDHALNIAETANEIFEKKISFSQEGENETGIMVSAINDIVDMTVSSFINDDVELAYKIEPFEQVIDDLCDKMKDNHLERIRNGQCTLEHGIVFNDLLVNYERVADHCENIAVEIIETKKESRESHKIKTELKDTNKELFDLLYKEYLEKYDIKKVLN